MMFVALCSAYPTEADARTVMDADVADLPYRGTWRMPPGLAERGPLVHVFADVTEQELADAGFTGGSP